MGLLTRLTGLADPEPLHAATLHENQEYLALVKAASEHPGSDPRDIMSHVTARHCLRNERRIEKEAYYRKHHIPEDIGLGSVIEEVTETLAASVVNLLLKLPHLFVLFCKISLAAGIILILVQYVAYGSMHYVVGPLVYTVESLINKIAGGIVGGFNKLIKGALSIARGIVHVIHVLDHHFKEPHIGNYAIKAPFKLTKKDLGTYFNDIVNMRKLCHGVYPSKMSVIQNGLRVFTASTACQGLRLLYPSPLLRWIPALLYGSDFANPAGENCKVHSDSIVCFAWVLDRMLMDVFYYLVVFEIVHTFWPVVLQMWRQLRALACAASYSLAAGLHTHLSFRQVLAIHHRSGCQFVPKADHALALLQRDPGAQLDLETPLLQPHELNVMPPATELSTKALAS